MLKEDRPKLVKKSFHDQIGTIYLYIGDKQEMFSVGDYSSTIVTEEKFQ